MTAMTATTATIVTKTMAMDSAMAMDGTTATRQQRFNGWHDHAQLVAARFIVIFRQRQRGGRGGVDGRLQGGVVKEYCNQENIGYYCLQGSLFR